MQIFLGLRSGTLYVVIMMYPQLLIVLVEQVFEGIAREAGFVVIATADFRAHLAGNQYY